MSRLKQCPFCRKKKLEISAFYSEVICFSCGAVVSFYDEKRQRLGMYETIEAWNRRGEYNEQMRI